MLRGFRHDRNSAEMYSFASERRSHQHLYYLGHSRNCKLQSYLDGADNTDVQKPVNYIKR